MKEISQFNVRVYGLLFNEHDQVLVSDERYKGHVFTKFPGGGLEFGEGLRDALKRECLEEMNQAVEVGDHFYTTDHFVASAFYPHHQLISVYYRMAMIGPPAFVARTHPFDFGNAEGDIQVFRWVPRQELDEASFRFPIDRVVVARLRSGD